MFDQNRCTMTGVLEGEIELREGHAREVALFTLRVNGEDPDGPGVYSQIVTCVAREPLLNRVTLYGQGARFEVTGWLAITAGMSSLIVEQIEVLSEPARAF